MGGQVVDHYQTLQIEQGSSVEDVKRAFRTLAKRYHPDKNPGQEEAAEQMFRRITTAYQILSDEQRRRLYDLTLDQPKAEHNPYLERLRHTQVRRKRCELMFQELLNHNINEGVRIYEELRNKKEKNKEKKTKDKRNKKNKIKSKKQKKKEKHTVESKEKK